MVNFTQALTEKHSEHYNITLLIMTDSGISGRDSVGPIWPE